MKRFAMIIAVMLLFVTVSVDLAEDIDWEPCARQAA